MNNNWNQSAPKQVTTTIHPAQDNPALDILQNRLKEQRIISLNKSKASIPSQIMQTAFGALSSALVHEIRNPLTNINLAADILKSGNIDEENILLLDVIKREATQIDNLLTDFLHASESEGSYSDQRSVNSLPGY